MFGPHKRPTYGHAVKTHVEIRCRVTLLTMSDSTYGDIRLSRTKSLRGHPAVSRVLSRRALARKKIRMGAPVRMLDSTLSLRPGDLWGTRTRLNLILLAFAAPDHARVCLVPTHHAPSLFIVHPSQNHVNRLIDSLHIGLTHHPATHYLRMVLIADALALRKKPESKTGIILSRTMPVS